MTSIASASEWSIDVTLLIAVICLLLISIGIVWICFKAGKFIEKIDFRE